MPPRTNRRKGFSHSGYLERLVRESADLPDNPNEDVDFPIKLRPGPCDRVSGPWLELKAAFDHDDRQATESIRDRLDRMFFFVD